VVELAGEGTDQINSSISLRLWQQGQHIENLSLTGSANIDGVGNAASNVLIGNAGDNALSGGGGADTLDGGLGADILSGGGGSDLFVLRADHGGAAADTITDFELRDSIEIKGASGVVQLAFTQVGSDTRITEDGVLVGTVLNANAAEVEARASVATTGTGSVQSNALEGFVTVALGGSQQRMFARLDPDAAFDFSGLTLRSGLVAPGGGSSSRMSMAEMFAETAQGPIVPQDEARAELWGSVDSNAAHWFRHFGAELELLV